MALDQPVNIHLTGCHHSCAQHYIGDIGLLGAKVAVDASGEETVEGYHVYVGGGFGADPAIGRELRRDVKADDVPALIERMLKAYLDRRESPAESFQAFTARHSDRRIEDPVCRGGDVMLAPLIPENAPFTTEQRAWLNGFFAGLLSLDGVPAVGSAALSAAAPAMGTMAAPLPEAADPLADGDDGEAPWHDPSIPLAERMELAEGRPLRRRLMAAMAQQDCGQCGYTCEEYANALVLAKEEARSTFACPAARKRSAC